MKMDLTAPESNDPILKLVSSSPVRSENGCLISITVIENDPVRGGEVDVSPDRKEV